MTFHYITETYLIKEIKEHNRFTNFLNENDTIQFIGYRNPFDLHSVNQPKMLMRAVVNGKETNQVMTETKAMNILTQYTTIDSINKPNLETLKNATLTEIQMKDDFIKVSDFAKIKFNTIIFQNILKIATNDSIVDVDFTFNKFGVPNKTLTIKIIYSVDNKYYFVEYEIIRNKKQELVSTTEKAYEVK